MSRTHHPEPTAILFQLLAELDGYEVHIHAVVQEWQTQRELILFTEAGRAMDRMRTLAVGIPELSAHWIMLMISHTELMHNLWRIKKGEPLCLSAEVDEHLTVVKELAGKCRRLLVHGGRVLHECFISARTQRIRLRSRAWHFLPAGRRGDRSRR